MKLTILLMLISMNTWANNIGPVTGGSCANENNCEVWIENTYPVGKGGLIHTKVKSGVLSSFGLTPKVQSLADNFCSYYNIGKADLLNATDEITEVYEDEKWMLKQSRLFSCTNYIYVDEKNNKKYFVLHSKGDFSLEKIKKFAKKSCGSLEPKFINNVYVKVPEDKEVTFNFDCYDPNLPETNTENPNITATPKIHQPLPYSANVSEKITPYNYGRSIGGIKNTSGGFDPSDSIKIKNEKIAPEEASSLTDFSIAKKQCGELGFKPKTEKFGKCVLELSK